MKRPFAVIGFSVLFALAAANFFSTAVNFCLSGLLAICAAVLLFCFRSLHGRRALLAGLCAGATAFAVYGGAYTLQYAPVAALDGTEATLTGTVTDLPQTSGSVYYYTIKTSVISYGGKTKPLVTNIRLRCTAPLSAQPFDSVKVKASLYLPPDDGQGGFGSRSYYRSRGLFLFAKPTGTPAVTKAAAKPLYSYAISLRQYITAAISENVWNDEGALTAGILIGNVQQLPEQIKNDFTDTGISHILAVSGTQISLIMQYLLLLFGALRLPRRAGAGVTAGAVLLFMAVTGFSSSVMRAGIMGLVYLAGILIRREADALNSLGFAVLALCVASPFAAADVGLLLSFSATLGMITVSQRFAAYAGARMHALPRRLRGLLKPPVGLLCETTGATLFTLPVILLSFGQLSLVTFLSNFVEVPLSLFVTLAAAVLVLLSPLSFLRLLVIPIAMLIRFAAAFMIVYAHALASLPFAAVSTRYAFVSLLLLFTAALAGIWILFRKRGASLKPCLACLCFACAFGIATYSVAANGVLEIAQLPVTDGSATVLLKGNRALVFDLAGSEASYQTTQYLKQHNAKQVDALILPAFDAKRTKYANDFLADTNADRIFLPGAYKSGENANASFVTSTVTIDWQGVIVSLQPSQNGKTLLALVRYGSSSAVLTGAADADASAYSVSAANLRADVLAYGGSLTKSFARAVKPQYGEQADESSTEYSGAMLLQQNCKVRRTGDYGTVALRTRGNGAYCFAAD